MSVKGLVSKFTGSRVLAIFMNFQVDPGKLRVLGEPTTKHDTN